MAVPVFPDLIIQPMTAEWHASNLVMLNAAFAESHFLAQATPMTLEDAGEFWTGRAQDPNFLYLVAIDAGEVVGHAYIMPRWEELMRHVGVVGLLVTPAYRQAGVVTALLEALVEQARANTGIELFLGEIAEDNPVSLHIAEKFGFQQVGQLPRAIKRGDGVFVTMIWLVKDLYK